MKRRDKGFKDWAEAEEALKAMKAWADTKPTREVLVTESVDEPRNWVVWGAFHESAHARPPIKLSHAVMRLRDHTRNEVTHIYEWWAPRWLVSAEELSVFFYAHELELFVRVRGIPKGFATVKEIYALRILGEPECGYLELPSGEKAMEVFREYCDADGDLVVILRQLLNVDQMTGTERDLEGMSMEGRLEW